jgi:hypothetical protein
MFLILIDSDRDMSIDFPLSESASSIVAAQWRQMADPHSREDFGRRAAARIESALLACVDCNLRPPTPAQLSYATAISEGLGIAIPPHALRLNVLMRSFIGMHEEAFKNWKRKIKDAPT